MNSVAAFELPLSRAVERPVRVLQVIEATLGGTLLFLDTIITATAGLPIQFGLAYSTLRATPALEEALEKARENGWEIFRLEMTREIEPLGDLRSTWELIKLYRQFKPDIVHCHSSKAGALGRLAAAAIPFNRPQVVYAPHSLASHLGKKYLLAERALAPLTSRLMPVTQSEADELVGMKLAASGKYTVVWPVVDCERFAVQDRDAARAALNLPHGVPIVVGIGRLTGQKAPLAFLDVLTKVKASKPDAMGIWIGDGELRGEFVEAIRARGVEGSVVLVGWKNDVRPWLAAADVYLSTSKYESFGYSVAEALAMQRPVVATDITGTCDIMDGELAAFRYPAGDSERAAELILQLLQEPTLWSHTGEAGRSLVAERFSFSKMRQSLEGLYAQLS